MQMAIFAFLFYDTQYTHHNLKYMLPQHCKTYNDVFFTD